MAEKKPERLWVDFETGEVFLPGQIACIEETTEYVRSDLLDKPLNEDGRDAQPIP